MKILGIVKEVNELDLAVALPNQLTGFVSINEISKLISERVERIANEDDSETEETNNQDMSLPKLDDFFHVGQIVQCSVVSVSFEVDKEKEKRKIELTLKPEVANKGLNIEDLVEGFLISGEVTSEEDKGFLVSLGDDLKGFLPFKENTGKKPNVGQVLLFAVKKKDKRIVTLTLDRTCANNSLSKVENIGCFYPGNKVQGMILSIQPKGVLVDVNGFSVIVDYLNYKEEEFEIGQQVEPRIMFLDRDEKYIGATLNLEKLEPSVNKTEIGALVEDAEVLRVDQLSGLLLDLPGIGRGFVHVRLC